MAVEARQVLAQVAQIEESINAAEQVIVGDVVFEIKGVEKSFLTTCLTPHHRDAPLPRNMRTAYHGWRRYAVEYFNTIGPEAEIQPEPPPASGGGEAG
jgi:hypothetical protein